MLRKELVASWSVFTTPFAVQRIRNPVQNAEVSDGDLQVTDRLLVKRGTRFPAWPLAGLLHGDFFLQPRCAARQHQAMAGRDVAGTLVVQILNRPADFNRDDIAGPPIVEVDPQAIGLRGEQLGAWR